MWRALVLFCSAAIGLLAMLIAVGCCYVTFATSDYRPILLAAVGFWLVASGCAASVYWLRGATPSTVFWLWAVPSAFVWAELARRGPAVFFGWDW